MKRTTQRVTLLAAMALTALAGRAATNVWNGLGADTAWSTPGNWSLGVAPVAGDVACFDGTASKACVIDVNINLGAGGICLAADFAGTVSQGASTITVIMMR